MKTWDLECWGDDCYMQVAEAGDGRFVEVEDHEAEVEALKREVADCELRRAMLHELYARIATIELEPARLLTAAPREPDAP